MQDTLSFLSCLGNSYQLHKTDIASSLQRAISPLLPRQVQWKCCRSSNNNNLNLTPEVSKAIFRLQKQGIRVTPKLLHRVKKKEAWKAIRRERKEKEKANRVPDPVWYDWPEELDMLEMSKLGITQAEEEGADEFLCFVEKACPTRRIAVHGINDVGSSVSRGDGSVSTQKKAINVPKRRTFVNKGSGGKTNASPVQSIAQVWRKSSPVTVENVSPSHHSMSEVCFPWTGKPMVEDSGAVHELKEYVLKDSNKLELTMTSRLDEGLSESKEGKRCYPFKEINTVGIEKFLDDEIDEVPKGQEVWIKGVGLVKNKKPEFSKEIKEMILARRRGDWSVLYEDDESESELNASSTVLFDGQAALLEDRRIQRLAARLQDINYWISKVHFSKIMHSGKMKLTEERVIRVIQILGEKGNWRRAMQVVQWVHKRQRYQFHISKFIFTTLISILGKARRPVEASTVFSVMRENFSSYPDIATYHAMAVTLGQAGQLKELLQLIESLEAGPPQPIKFIPLIHWDPILHPDIVVFNSVLIACISAKEWAGVTWTWNEIEKRHIKPNGATFGLTIEAMVKANNFNQAIRYYNRMERAGFPPNAQTYKCLVEAFGKAKMTDEAMELVKEMETSGIIGNASVYFALACSFCIAGRLKEALVQVKKIHNFSSRKPDVVTYTGLIQTCHKVGRIQDAIFLFKHMQHTCAPNVRTCNEMIKLYGWNGMFEEARKVYNCIKQGQLESCLLFDGATKLCCDSFTFELMLKAALVSEKWDYFDSVYWDMISQGYHLSGKKTNQWVLLKVARLKKIDIADDMLQRLRKSGEVPQLSLYEAHILSCLQARYIEKALMYLNDMRIDGYEVLPTIHSLQEHEHVQREAWDSLIQMLKSLETFSDTCEER